MNLKAIFVHWMPTCFAIALTVPVSAQVVSVGGPLRAGHARPPLYQNRGPFTKSGRGSGGTSVYYTPAQIRHAYGFDGLPLSVGGTGQTIAIVDAYGSPSIQTDLNTFCTQFGVPPMTVDIRYPEGLPGGNTGWAQETSLDVEWAHAIAPGANIMLVVAVDSSLNNLMTAVDYAVANGATVVSMSWGAAEFSGETSLDSHFNRLGVTFVASSGDSGESTSVEWPAVSPYVVGVGGTSLYLDTSFNRTSETAWSGSGGGISKYEVLQPWQVGWSPWLTSSTRGVPDVSYVANPSTGVLVVYGGALYVFGGTSVGAPQWSALVALSNSLRSSGSLSSADSAIYSVAQGPLGGNGLYTINSAYLFDITSGSDGRDADDKAVAGYDLVTGLGSPVANSLAPALSSR